MASALELFFDLIIVVAFSVSSSELAHLLAHGRVTTGLIGFGFAMFAVIWAWISYSWFMSAFDTDDWFVRLATMLQMIGVSVLTLGLPPLFASIDEGHYLDNGVMVGGYVIMRIGMIALWIRVAATNHERRSVALTYASTLVVAQIGWVALAVLHLPMVTTGLLIVPLYLIETIGPFVAETRKGGTPWHPHHIAERYGALALIALGEVVLGTVTALGALIGETGWTTHAAVLLVAGIGMAFGMWWSYFCVPYGEFLHLRPDKAFGWAYSHLVLFASIAATGAGLHVVALMLEGQSHASTLFAILTIAVPEIVFLMFVFVAVYRFLPTYHQFHTLLVVVTLALAGAGVGLAASGVNLMVCLLVLMAVPWVTVVGYETLGHRHLADGIAELERRAAASAPGLHATLG